MTLIVANWKCNPATLKEAKRIFNEVKNYPAVICPPFPFIPALGANGSQDVFWKNFGAYTGEVSPLMLKNLGVKYVIVGHSERRKYQKENDEVVAKKAKAVLAAGLKPILCAKNVYQIRKDLRLIKDLKFKIENLIIAFEPLSAVGTGRPYNVKKAAKMYLSIRNIVGEKPLILYGGSVDSKNARNYVKEAGFQGLLVGRASLEPKEFIGIIRAVY